MIYKTDKVYIGRIWYYDSLTGEIKPISNQIRVFYLTKYQFNYLHSSHPAFKDILSGRWFPIDTKNIVCDPLLVPYVHCMSLKDFFKKESLPKSLTHNSLLELYKMIYEMQKKEYEINKSQSEEEPVAKEECKQRVLTQEEN